jgi:Flp pilus assembly protein TadB
MSSEGPRHRGRPSELTRRAERKVVHSFIAMTLMAAFLIWVAVGLGNIMLVIVSSIGAVTGVWLSGGRMTRRRKHVAARGQ